MRRLTFVLSLATIVLLPQTQPRAADPRNPDWPCVQIKVPEISIAAVWAGPPLDLNNNKWESDPKLEDLVPRLAARRTPIEQAQKMAAEFVGSGDGKQERGKLLFAALFDAMNRSRGEVINGIERYTRHQREYAEQVRSETLKLRELQDDPKSDAKQVEQMSEKVEWDTRIFEDRRRTIRYVCEVPVLIEQRLFAIGRTIQQVME